MEKYITGYDGQGQPIYAEELAAEEIVTRLKESAEWATFIGKFDMGKASNNTLFGMLIDEKLGPDPTVEDYKNLLRIVTLAGGIVTLDGTTYEFELKEAEPEPAPEPEVPRDKNGNPLSESQLKWSEYRQFAEAHSSPECRDRARVDSGFASFVRLNLQREAQNTPSIQFSTEGQVSTKGNDRWFTHELVAFAEEYRLTSTEQIRKLRSPVMNPLGFKTFIDKESAAASAGLLGR